MKTPKTYRLSPACIKALDKLKEWHQYEALTETDLVEIAIMGRYADELTIRRSMSKEDTRGPGD